MSGARPFRFSAQAFSATSAKEWRETALRAEALGYSALHLADHYFGPGPVEASTHHPVQGLAAVPAMAMAAEATDGIRIGCRVFCVDYHLPAVLAKEAATLDLLSEGRLELGLGAGWVADEYEAMGIPFDPPGTRVDRLGEVIALVKAHCSGAPIEIDGAHVAVHGYSGVPEPVQRPHPPIMVGGGARRVLGLAGREADIVSLNFDNRSGVIGGEGVRSSTAVEMDRKLEWVRDGAGERFGDLEIETAAYFTVLTDDGAGAAAGLGSMFGLEPEEMRSHPNALLGSVDEICEELERRRERHGISYVAIPQRQMDAFAPVVARMHGR